MLFSFGSNFSCALAQYCCLWNLLEMAVPSTGQPMMISHTGKPCSLPLPFMPQTILKVNREEGKKKMLSHIDLWSRSYEWQ